MSFTRDELAKAIPHVVFDFFHFRFYNRHLSDRSPAWCHAAVRQAVRYALLLHFRVVWDFFYKPPTRDDCAIDKFRELPEFAAAFQTKIEQPPGADKLKDSLNKLLAHMTATRWEKPRPAMSFYQAYFASLETLISGFRAALPADLQKTYDERVRLFENLYKERL